MQRGAVRGSLPRRVGPSPWQCRAARSRPVHGRFSGYGAWQCEGVGSVEDRAGLVQPIPRTQPPPLSTLVKRGGASAGAEEAALAKRDNNTVDAARPHYGTDGRAWQWGISLPSGGEIPHFKAGLQTGSSVSGWTERRLGVGQDGILPHRDRQAWLAPGYGFRNTRPCLMATRISPGKSWTSSLAIRLERCFSTVLTLI